MRRLIQFINGLPPSQRLMAWLGFVGVGIGVVGVVIEVASLSLDALSYLDGKVEKSQKSDEHISTESKTEIDDPLPDSEMGAITPLMEAVLHTPPKILFPVPWTAHSTTPPAPSIQVAELHGNAGVSPLPAEVSGTAGGLGEASIPAPEPEPPPPPIFVEPSTPPQPEPRFNIVPDWPESPRPRVPSEIFVSPIEPELPSQSDRSPHLSETEESDASPPSDSEEPQMSVGEIITVVDPCPYDPRAPALLGEMRRLEVPREIAGGLSGKVLVLRVLVDEAGNGTLIATQGEALSLFLDNRAREAVEETRWLPGLDGCGKAREMPITVKYVFD